MDEFELISRYFARHSDAPGVLTGIGDDGAVLRPNAAADQVQVIDTLVAGVHFPDDTCPADIGYRIVAVNLSDIAAMGARPVWMTLAVTLPTTEPDWLNAFAQGLFEAANGFDVALVGGDTTAGPVTVVTVSITGEVPPGSALLRSGARPGHTVFVTGTLGDAAAGLDALGRGERDSSLIQRFLRPTPRIEIGKALRGKASAAIDISDGLAGDLTKLLSASGVGADIDLQRLPLSDALRESCAEERGLRLALTGGDDYELCFTAHSEVVATLPGITAIGRITETAGLRCLDNGSVVEVDNSGYRHFQ